MRNAYFFPEQLDSFLGPKRKEQLRSPSLVVEIREPEHEIGY